jgi:hypothetical protein
MRDFWLHVVIDLFAVAIIAVPALVIRAHKTRS